MEIILLSIILLLLIILIILLFQLKKAVQVEKDHNTFDVLMDLKNKLESLNTGFKGDLSLNRKEMSSIARENRDELSRTLRDFTNEQNSRFGEFKSDQNDMSAKMIDQLEKIKEIVQKSLKHLNEQGKADNNSMRDTLSYALKAFQDSFEKNVKAFNDLQREKFVDLGKKQDQLVSNTEIKLENIRVTVEEKLEKTLSERLGQSFESVSKHLIEVQKGLGEMQNLAQDVGGLKKVLSNVKMRGGIGELQLAMLLEQILAPDQYEANVKTKTGSSDLVEFAIKLPGKDEEFGNVWLPIDAKFPKDVYEKLQTAYEYGNQGEIDIAQKSLESTIRKMAKDIKNKYVEPPHTTDFAIMFLPFEGIYAEVVRKASLLEELQRNYKVVVTGPTTLAAILNSLHIGFRTLAIQKRSSEVWKVLGEVKAEFSNFGGLLQKAQKNFQTGLNQLDDVIGRRTKAIQRKLRGVESLKIDNGQNLYPEVINSEAENEENED